jgi:hypothetical protein
MREGTTLLYVPSLSKCIMYGGRGKEVFNSIVTLDTATWQWTNLGLGSEDVPLEGRLLPINISTDSATLPTASGDQSSTTEEKNSIIHI